MKENEMEKKGSFGLGECVGGGEMGKNDKSGESRRRNQKTAYG
jgi:hypothetical protein